MSTFIGEIMEAYENGETSPTATIRELMVSLAELRSEMSHITTEAKRLADIESAYKSAIADVASRANVTTATHAGLTFRAVEGAITAVYDVAKLDSLVAELLASGQTELAQRISSARSEKVRAGYARIETAKGK